MIIMGRIIPIIFWKIYIIESLFFKKILDISAIEWYSINRLAL